MPGFQQRFTAEPTIAQLTAIEGVNVIDLPPIASFAGLGTGTVAMLGEFPDCSFAVAVDVNGNVTTKAQPTQILSAADLIAKCGGFDETIGAFGSDQGNGFVELRNKKFSGLVLVPINLASAKGWRLWRSLPTNINFTSPVPGQAMQAASVAAGREFLRASDRVRNAKLVTFTGAAAYATGADGAVTPAGLPAAAQNLVSAGANFAASGTNVQVGDAVALDVLVSALATVTDNPLTAGAVTANVGSTAGFNPSGGFIKIESEYIQYAGTTGTSFTGLTRGVLGSAAASHAQGTVASQVNDAGTYRVAAVVSATTLTLERQDGSNFTQTNWVAETAVVYRVHHGSDADSGGAFTVSQAGGYVVPARPLTNGSGSSSTNGLIPAAALCTPKLVPPAQTNTTWDPLSGLTARTDPTTGLVYTAAVQQPNAPDSSALDALYQTAVNALLDDNEPSHSVTVVFSARKSNATVDGIQTALRAHVLASSATGRGRLAVIAPTLTMLIETTVVGATAPGVGVTADERAVYCWPGLQTFVSEAVPFALACADGVLTSPSDPVHQPGNLDVGADGWMASIMSNLATEKNPGQSAPPVPVVMASVIGLQHGAPTLAMSDYVLLRQSGVAAPKRDRQAGIFGFQSGITSNLLKPRINRRRFADEVEDSLSELLLPMVKQVLTLDLQDAIVNEITAYLLGLQSPNAPGAARLQSFVVDRKGGNRPDLLAVGVYVVNVTVVMFPTADFITLRVNVDTVTGTVNATAAI